MQACQLSSKRLKSRFHGCNCKLTCRSHARQILAIRPLAVLHQGWLKALSSQLCRLTPVRRSGSYSRNFLLLCAVHEVNAQPVFGPSSSADSMLSACQQPEQPTVWASAISWLTPSIWTHVAVMPGVKGFSVDASSSIKLMMVFASAPRLGLGTNPSLSWSHVGRWNLWTWTAL